MKRKCQQGKREWNLTYETEDRQLSLDLATLPQLVHFGTERVMPDRDTLERHARQLIQQDLSERLRRENRKRLEAQATAIALPDTLNNQVRAILERQPGMSWDQAIAHLVGAIGDAL